MNRKVALAMALAAVAIGSAQASTLYIGGSSAFRKTAYSALTANGWAAKANDGTSLTDSGGTRILYTNASGDYISTCWSGSEAGVQSVCAGTNNRPLLFFATNASGNIKATNAGAGITTNADAAFSDCSASISRYNGLTNAVEIINGQSVIANYTTPASEQTVGIQSFTFLASETFPTNKATGISANAAKVLFEKGVIPLSLITGNAADSNSFCWLTGRNPDSGTRLTAYNEVGYGALSKTKNYKITNKDTNAKVITEIAVWPSENINGLVTAPGDSGQSSGGTLVGTLAPMSNTLSVVDATITYETNAVTNTVYETNYPTLEVVTTNQYTTTVVSGTRTVTNYWTNYTFQTNYTWANRPVTNKVYVTYNRLWTNSVKSAGTSLFAYVPRIKGAIPEASLVSNPITTNTIVKGVGVTKLIRGAVFIVNEYSNNILNNNWVQVPSSVSSNPVQVPNGTYTLTNYSTTTNYYYVTNYAVSQDPVITSNEVVSSLTIPTGTNYSTNTITADAHYLITYASVSDALTKGTLSSNWPVLLNYNGDGVGGYTDYSTTTKNTIQAKIKNGSYTYWNFEQALLSPSADAGAQTVFTDLVNIVKGNVTAPNCNLSDLNITRSSDGSTVYSK